MRNKQKGRDTGGDVVKAMKTEALISAGVIDESAATDSDKLDATLNFVDTVSEAQNLGVDMKAQLSDLGSKSVEELEAKTEFTTSQNQLVEEGVLTADDAKDRAENSSNLSVDQLKAQSQSNNSLKEQIDQGLDVQEAKLIAENETAASESPELLQLLDELKELNLSDQELSVVLQDLKTGPQVSAPTDTPNSVSTISLESEFTTISLLEDYSISENFGSVTTMSSEKAFASAFFSDLVDTYDALSELDSSNYVDGDEHNEQVLGGRNISISTGTYDFDASESTFDYLIAATEKLTLLGDLVFNPNNTSVDSTLIMMSAKTLDIAKSTSISFNGNELGLGSFESLNIEEVSLTAEGQVSLRSLDNVVINNSSMTTSGKGADFIHLIAANEITANSLQFSSQVQKITMEAMTINLSNINFPSGSSVNLNSLYGGIDGKYPNFGNTQYGRVNFIQNIMYGSNSITDTSTFDLHGGNIKIGTTGF
jgi:hypothetical protein